MRSDGAGLLGGSLRGGLRLGSSRSGPRWLARSRRRPCWRCHRRLLGGRCRWSARWQCRFSDRLQMRCRLACQSPYLAADRTDEMRSFWLGDRCGQRLVAESWLVTLACPSLLSIGQRTAHRCLVVVEAPVTRHVGQSNDDALAIVQFSKPRTRRYLGDHLPGQARLCVRHEPASDECGRARRAYLPDRTHAASSLASQSRSRDCARASESARSSAALQASPRSAKVWPIATRHCAGARCHSGHRHASRPARSACPSVAGSGWSASSWKSFAVATARPSRSSRRSSTPVRGSPVTQGLLRIRS